MPFWLVLVVIGLLGGFASGLFGVGGGIVIVPALIYWAGFTQHKATGTSLAVLLPPIGLLAALEYYRNGNVDVRAAIILATMMMIGAWGEPTSRTASAARTSDCASEFSCAASASILSTVPVGGLVGCRLRRCGTGFARKVLLAAAFPFFRPDDDRATGDRFILYGSR